MKASALGSHTSEWKSIRERYRYMVDMNFTKYLPKEALEFRIECIDDLINQEEIKDNPEHFK